MAAWPIYGALAMARLPVILQTEASECGLACMAMIAGYFGHKIDLPVLRAQRGVSLHGASLRSLIDMAGDLQLSPQAVRLDLEHLPELQLPAIAHWDFNHYVVIEKLSGDSVTIVDPGKGRRKVSMKRFSDSFTGVALQLTPVANFTPIHAQMKPKLSMLWSRLTGLKRAIVQTLLLSVVLQIIIIASPFFLQLVVDGVLPRADFGLLAALALGFGGLAILRAVTEALRSWAILVFGNQMSAQMVGNIFHQLIRLPTDFFEKRHVGDIISRIGSAQPIQKALTQSLVAAIMDGVMAILMMAVMFIYSPKLLAIVVMSVVLLAGVTICLYPKIRQSQEELIEARAIENTHVIESIRASTTLKLFGRQGVREAGWRNLYSQVINASTDHGKWVILQRFAEQLITGLQMIAIVYFGVQLVMTEASGFTLGMLFAFLAYRADFTLSAVGLISQGIQFRLLGLHLDRLSDIVMTPPEKLSAVETAPRGPLKGDIRLENVWFRYGPNDRWILEDVSLHFKAGEMATISGLSGGGKTTLLKLILGLYAPDRGRILIDGMPLEERGVSTWRREIGVVMQEDQLLSGTVAENISLFDPEMDMPRVHRAASAARIDSEVSAFPMGYDSLVGNMGSVLSGGQKQRVLLARALYHEPSVLFLDEGTANLDSQTESEIVSVIKDMPMTRIIVAHRPAFIEAADQTIVI